MHYYVHLEPRSGSKWGLPLRHEALVAAGLRPPLAAVLADGRLRIVPLSESERCGARPIGLITVNGHWEAQLEEPLLCAAGLMQQVLVTAERGLISVT